MFKDIISDDKIKVVENCVDHTFMINSNVIKNKIDNISIKKEINIVYLSNMIYTKGYFDVLESAKILCNKGFYNFYFAGMFPTDDSKKNLMIISNQIILRIMLST